MPGPTPAVAGKHRHGRSLDREVGFPGALLVDEDLYTHLIFLNEAGVHHPDHGAACFLVVALHSDDVAHLQFIFDTREQRALGADVLSTRVLRKRAPLGSHAPNPHAQVYGNARFGLLASHGLPRDRIMPIIPPTVPRRYY